MPYLKPTQKSVAKEAEVSQGLVSLVLSGADVEITEATRIRILETAKRLGYSPKKKTPIVAKRVVPSKRGKILAYIPPIVGRDVPLDHSIYDAYDEFYDRFQNRLVELAFKKGYVLIVRPYENPTELTSWLIEWGVDGVILHTSDKSLGEWIAKRFPMVQINRRLVSESDVVVPDQEEMIAIAMKHLWQNGHRRIALAASSMADYSLNRRKQAYFDCARRMDLRAYEEFLSCESVDEIASMLFDKNPERPTAIIAGDPSALMLQKEAFKRGLSLPADLSIVGIDNISADIFGHPPLTSIDIQMDEIARAALSLITARLKEPTLAFQKIEITPKLIIRESVAMFSDSPIRKSSTRKNH